MKTLPLIKAIFLAMWMYITDRKLLLIILFLFPTIAFGYDIQYVDKPCPAYENALGCFNHTTRQISIKNTLQGDELKMTIYHELGHFYMGKDETLAEYFALWIDGSEPYSKEFKRRCNRRCVKGIKELVENLSTPNSTNIIN